VESPERHHRCIVHQIDVIVARDVRHLGQQLAEHLALGTLFGLQRLAVGGQLLARGQQHRLGGGALFGRCRRPRDDVARLRRVPVDEVAALVLARNGEQVGDRRSEVALDGGAQLAGGAVDRIATAEGAVSRLPVDNAPAAVPAAPPRRARRRPQPSDLCRSTITEHRMMLAHEQFTGFSTCSVASYRLFELQTIIRCQHLAARFEAMRIRRHFR
jgi:hypothetical protein